MRESVFSAALRTLERIGAEPLKRGMLRAERFDVNNVARYLYEEARQDVYEMSDFRLMAPPFPVFWMEYGVPLRVRTGAGWTDHPDGLRGISFGALFNTHDLVTGKNGCLTDDEVSVGNGILRQTPPKDGPWRWSMSGSLFMYKPGFPAKFAEVSNWNIDPNGVPSQDYITSRANFMPPRKGMSPAFFSMLFALGLMQCKNVYINEPAPVKRKRGQQLKKVFTFKTLRIEPMTKIIRRSAGDGPVTASTALHVCRGHFKTFDEKPLFGKHKGTYWWNHSVRGSEDAGQVIKDYSVG